jgi:hypothetical protein
MGVKKLIDRVVNKLKQFAKDEGIVDSDKWSVNFIKTYKLNINL